MTKQIQEILKEWIKGGAKVTIDHFYWYLELVTVTEGIERKGQRKELVRGG